MEEYINKQEILNKIKVYQDNVFGIPLIISEIERTKSIKISKEILDIIQSKNKTK